MAMLIPTTPRYSRSYYLHKADIIEKGIRDADKIEDRNKAEEERLYHIHRMKQISDGAESMSHRVEHMLMPYVNFLIMPIFALVNAGVHIDSLSYFNIFEHSPELGSIGIGIFFGLVIGKPLGISLFSFLAVKLGVAERPQGASWKMLFAVACLGGIGFTMSIFVDNLAFDAATHMDLINKGKISIIMASTCAALLGSLLIIMNSKKTNK
jgi:NhaA family Na+:H+ antiporter